MPVCSLLIFAKAPIPGRVKTRLAARLGAAEAARLHRACVLDTIHLASSVPGCARRVLVAPGGNGWPRGDFALPPGWRLGEQRGRDLGQRLATGIAEEFAGGARKVLVVGTDTPWMGRQAILEAIGRLDNADVVLGPASDGGYYLLATRRPAAPIFQGIPWGTAETLNATRRELERSRLSYRLLKTDFDLDRPGDLERARALLGKEPRRARQVASWLCGERREAS